MKRMRLQDLMIGIPAHCPDEAALLEVGAITGDSRTVSPGSLFVALKGMVSDGHDFVSQAIEAGAVAVVVNSDCPVPQLAVPVIRVADTRMVIGRLAAVFYGNPAARMVVIGITGTNGKTTCSYLLESMLAESGARPGVIGTVTYRFAGNTRPASHTTPDPVQLQALMAEMVEQNVSHLIMEVSSHALGQGRVEGVMFDLALFTNLSREHLDFHGDMEGYFRAKETLFSRHLKEKGQAVIVSNGPQSWGGRLVAGLRHRGSVVIRTCGHGQMVDSSHVQLSLAGIRMQVRFGDQQAEFTSPLIGGFNVENILVAVGAGQGLGIPLPAMQRTIAKSHGAPGRMEMVVLPEVAHPTVIVDYAHTPDALENVLATIKPLTRGRLLLVFGCGGDRDRGKRPLMGAIAVRYADLAIVTSDNPRTEDPARIVAEIEEGMREAGGVRSEVDSLHGHGKEYLIIESRHLAIARAVKLAARHDVVLICGKGHEDYQLSRAGKVHFDDRLEAKKELEKVWGRGAGAA